MFDTMGRHDVVTATVCIVAEFRLVPTDNVNAGKDNFAYDAPQNAPGKAELRDMFVRYIKALNRHDTDGMAEFIHAEIIENGIARKRSDIVADLQARVAAVPDVIWWVEDLVIEGDTIAARLFNTGTPEKTWLGVEPTGVTVEYPEFAFHKVRDGKFCEMNYVTDVLAAQNTPDR